MRKSRSWKRGTSSRQKARRVVAVVLTLVAVSVFLTLPGVLYNRSLPSPGSPASPEGQYLSRWTGWSFLSPRNLFRFSKTRASQHSPEDTDLLEERRRSVAFASWSLLNAEPVERPITLVSDLIVDPACRPFQRSLHDVAVVGNGPLSVDQREEISQKGLVIRFNFLNNMWRDSERIDIWAVRYTYETRHHFWGFGQLPLNEALSILNRTQSMWLIGGETWAPYNLVDQVPEVAQHEPVHISQDAFLSNGSSEAPSTGFIGLKMVLGCTRPGTKVHIYGMNWTPKMWAGHQPQVEAEFVIKLQASGRLVVHRTPCRNMRTCDGVELDSDCHLDLHHRFVCPKVVDGNGTSGDREFASTKDIIRDAYKMKNTYLGNLASNGKVMRRQPYKRGRKGWQTIALH